MLAPSSLIAADAEQGERWHPTKDTKGGSDANPGASGNHYCLRAVPSAFPGTYQT